MRSALITLFLLSGCAAASGGPPTTVPAIVGAGPQSSLLNIVYGAQRSFRDTRALAGQPADAAVAVARLEYLAKEVPRDLTFYNLTNLTGPALGAARGDARRAVGIASDAPTQAVVDGLGIAAQRLVDGDETAARAALPSPTFSPDTLARLGMLPDLPQANAALLLLTRGLEFGRDDELASLGRPGLGRR